MADAEQRRRAALASLAAQLPAPVHNFNDVSNSTSLPRTTVNNQLREEPGGLLHPTSRRPGDNRYRFGHNVTVDIQNGELPRLVDFSREDGALAGSRWIAGS
jgi:hypothetical protein